MADLLTFLTPGPTPVPPEVRDAMARPLPYHESDEFRTAYRRAVDNIAWLFKTSGEPVVANSSITGACASVFTNLIGPGDDVICAVNGHFSNLWRRLAEAAGATVHLVEAAWGTRIDPEEVETALARHPGTRLVCIAHCETTTGAVSDVRTIAELAHAAGALVAVDAASTFGAAPLDVDGWDLDVAVAGSQKALGAPPGLAFVALSDRALIVSEARRCPRLDWDWSKLRTAQVAGSLYTPAISLWLGVDASLSLCRDRGHEGLWQRSGQLARAARAGVRALGLELLSPDDETSRVITTIRAPNGVDSEAIQRELAERFGVLVAIGHPEFMRTELWRISSMGYVADRDLLTAIGGLGELLAEEGYVAAERAGDGATGVMRSLHEEHVHPAPDHA